ncbi:3-methyladenine DNA glycosylase [Nocardioidaceae bacterium]|nr:3-methyladenine DNA glycosylase [Nocardioidaceae bacterium]
MPLDRPPAPTRLPREEWRTRRAAHEARVDVWLEPHLERRRRGEKHPVMDFLFDYYAHRPAQLRTWAPGWDVALEWDHSVDGPVPKHHVLVDGWCVVDPGLLGRREVLVTTLRRLLAATASRPAQLGCLGLHEWAMVYRTLPGQQRHEAWPLRLGHDGTDEVVESHQLTCTHFDAFRFFTEPAVPRNRHLPRAEDREAYEQPGCLHAGMDLYKHAFRLWPLVSSDLVADCFELAREIRVLDMEASPYDLADLGHSPVRIETPEGKRAYVERQRDLSERGAPLRRRLLDACRMLESQSASRARA